MAKSRRKSTKKSRRKSRNKSSRVLTDKRKGRNVRVKRSLSTRRRKAKGSKRKSYKMRKSKRKSKRKSRSGATRKSRRKSYRMMEHIRRSDFRNPLHGGSGQGKAWGVGREAEATTAMQKLWYRGRGRAMGYKREGGKAPPLPTLDFDTVGKRRDCNMDGVIWIGGQKENDEVRKELGHIVTGQHLVFSFLPWYQAEQNIEKYWPSVQGNENAQTWSDEIFWRNVEKKEQGILVIGAGNMGHWGMDTFRHLGEYAKNSKCTNYFIFRLSDGVEGMYLGRMWVRAGGEGGGKDAGYFPVSSNKKVTEIFPTSGFEFQLFHTFPFGKGRGNQETWDHRSQSDLIVVVSRKGYALDFFKGSRVIHEDPADYIEKNMKEEEGINQPHSHRMRLPRLPTIYDIISLLQRAIVE